VEYARDRFPSTRMEWAPARLMAVFNKIKDLCGMTDSAGLSPAPSLWSYSKMTANGKSYSRLDRIYRPITGWTASSMVPMDTGHSDHRMMIAPVYPRWPKIEKAKPAPRLPNMELLGKAKKFAPAVLQAWKCMAEAGPVMLEKWTTFKREVLNTGLREVRAMKNIGKKDWVAALKCETVPPEEIMSAVTKANRQLWARRRALARDYPAWPSAIPAYETPSRISKHFIASASSPWQVPVKRQAEAADRCQEAMPLLTPTADKGVMDLLRERAEHLETSTKAKWERMTRTHSSEWFKQSSNKELDERGSRASVSVEGLRRPADQLA